MTGRTGLSASYAARAWKIFSKCICRCLGPFFKWPFLAKKCIYSAIYIPMKNIDKTLSPAWSRPLPRLAPPPSAAFARRLGDGLLPWLLPLGLALL